MEAKSEFGRELKANELKVNTVVIVGRKDRPYSYTAWVREIGQDSVVFYSGVSKTYFIAFLREDGELVDDSGQRIIVLEYLGEV